MLVVVVEPTPLAIFAQHLHSPVRVSTLRHTPLLVASQATRRAAQCAVVVWAGASDVSTCSVFGGRCRRHCFASPSV